MANLNDILSDKLPNVAPPVPSQVEDANGTFDADAAFALTKAISRPYAKGTIVFLANASGNWVPQQASNVPLIFFQHGVADALQGTTNPFANAGISGTVAKQSVEFTSSQYYGGFSMTLQALILAVGIVQERIRYHAAATGWAVIDTTALVPGIAPRAGGIVGDYEWALGDRLLFNVLGASEWQLLPYSNNIACPLFLGVPQLMTARVGGEMGGPSTSQDQPSMQWRFRADILVNPGVQGSNVMPNQLQLSWLDGVLDSVEKITGSPSKTTGTFLALDIVVVVDVAFGLMRPAGYFTFPVLDAAGNQTGTRTNDKPMFQFASAFDAAKYECYRNAV